MNPEDWYEAYLLFAFVCPCDAVVTVNERIARAPADQPDVFDCWLRLETCANAILDSVTVR